MAKPIKLTPQMIDGIQGELITALQSMKLSNGRFEFKHEFTCNGRATLTFAEVAWAKMMALITTNPKEVAWHCFAHRGNDLTTTLPSGEEIIDSEYVVEDIVVYPQLVSAAYVDTDDEEYMKWRDALSDEDFNRLRGQGHSHVAMATSPSNVDTELYRKFLAQLGDDDFYVFMIWNKRDERTIFIYDMLKNIMYETKDVTVVCRDDGLGIKQFVDSAADLVKERQNITAVSKPSYGGGYTGSGYGGTTYTGGGISCYTPGYSGGSIYDDEEDETWGYDEMGTPRSAQQTFRFSEEYEYVNGGYIKKGRPAASTAKNSNGTSKGGKKACNKGGKT